MVVLMAEELVEESDLLSENSKAELSLERLPFDIQNSICQYLSTVDIAALSCLSRSYRGVLKRILFRRVKTTWANLVKNHEFLRHHQNYIKELRIVDSYLYGEWHIDLGELLKPLESLYNLLINTNSSSNWLKYRANDTVQELNLYVHPDHGFHDKAFVQISHLRFFSVEDVVGFSQLQKLSLSNFHFYWDLKSVPSSFSLHHLCISNCTWDYPFELSHFNVKNTIKVLEIGYLRDHSFLISERFEHLYLGNEEAFDKLETLKFEVYQNGPGDGRHLRKFLNVSLLLKFINRERFPSLSYLSLCGLGMSARDFISLLDNLHSNGNQIDILRLQLVCDEKHDLAERIRDKCREKHNFINLLIDIDEI